MTSTFKANASSLAAATLINFEGDSAIQNGPATFYLSDGTNWYSFSKICCDKAEKIGSGACPSPPTTPPPTTTTTTTTLTPTTTTSIPTAYQYEVTGDGSGDFTVKVDGSIVISDNCGFGGCTTTLCILGGPVTASVGSIAPVFPVTPCDPPINP